MNSKERWNYLMHHYMQKEIDWTKVPRSVLLLAWLKFLIKNPIATIRDTIREVRS